MLSSLLCLFAGVVGLFSPVILLFAFCLDWKGSQSRLVWTQALVPA
jgi:hypothetical protein